MVGRVTEEEKWRLLGSVDLLCAPSLGGESFGMVLTEAFASGTPVVASDIAGYRDVVRDGVDGILVPAGDAGRARRGAGRAGVRSRLAASGWPRPRASAPSASRGRAWPPRSPRSTSRRSPCRAPRPDWPAWRCAPGSRPPSPDRACGPERLPSLEPEDAALGRRKTARLARRAVIVAGAAAGAGPHRARARAARHRVDRPRAARRHAGLGARGLHADVPLDAGARRGLERDPARRAARHARAPPRHRPRDDDRRADVGHPAGPPRRALARADRVAPAGPDARPLPGRARHARVADASQHPRPVRARHGHVRHGRRVQPRRGRARDRHHRSGRAARARDLGALDPAPRQAVALPARAAGGGRRARAR